MMRWEQCEIIIHLLQKVIASILFFRIYSRGDARVIFKE
jgi:hypothetical protein